MDKQIDFTLNGRRASVTADAERSLLEVLREDLGLTGAKYGCGEAQCGACSVLLNGKRVFSCRTAVGKAAGAEVTTIEGIGTAGPDGNAVLHSVQEAFVAEGAYQCGYCVPGMVVAAVALLKENPKPTEEQIVEGMNRNLCRCCNYKNLVAAVKRAAGRMAGEGK